MNKRRRTLCRSSSCLVWARDDLSFIEMNGGRKFRRRVWQRFAMWEDRLVGVVVGGGGDGGRRLTWQASTGFLPRSTIRSRSFLRKGHFIKHSTTTRGYVSDEAMTPLLRAGSSFTEETMRPSQYK